MKIKLNYENLLIDNIYYGGNQEWYKTHIKRLSGCAPTTASTITMYEKRKEESKNYTKEEFKRLMHNMWNYITPGIMGVNKAEIYTSGYDRFIRNNNMKLYNKNILHIDKNKKITKEEALLFLIESLKNDHPVAFLNLDNGKETNIESWHWVTIVGMNYEEGILSATICDEGYLKDINLGLWLETTTYGDFIYYY